MVDAAETAPPASTAKPPDSNAEILRALAARAAKVGVRAWLARGYFIPGGASQRGGSQTPAFRVARCRTQSLVDIGLGSVGSRQGSSGLVGDPYGSVS